MFNINIFVEITFVYVFNISFCHMGTYFIGADVRPAFWRGGQAVW